MFKETFRAIGSIKNFVKVVEVECTLCVNDDDSGWFEFADEKGKWYAEGNLNFYKNELIEFNGIEDLPYFIKEKLTDWGFLL